MWRERPSSVCKQNGWSLRYWRLPSPSTQLPIRIWFCINHIASFWPTFLMSYIIGSLFVFVYFFSFPWINVGLCRNLWEDSGLVRSEIRKSPDSGDFSRINGKSTPSEIKTWWWSGWTGIFAEISNLFLQCWCLVAVLINMTQNFCIYKL